MSTVEFAFEENLARAATLPSAWYTDAAIFHQEKERIFARTWNLVGRAEQAAAPGDYFTTAIADEPIIVVHGADGELRAFANVCRHRAGPVAAGEGNRKVFQCGYHGWTYALDGRLIGTPEFDGVECFDKAANCLPEFAVARCGALIFVNLDRQTAPLAETLEDLSVRLVAHDLAAMRFAARKEWVLDCNWKTYVDNYLEGYHIPVVHPALSRELDYQNYRTETRRYYSTQHAPLRQTPGARLRHAARGDDDKAQFIWVFPNLMLNIYPDNYSTNLIVPLGPERTLTLFEWYFRDPERDEVQAKLRRTIEFSDEVQIEDIRICEAVQRGLRSRTYRTGRYSVKRENGVHHFHRLIAECFAQG